MAPTHASARLAAAHPQRTSHYQRQVDPKPSPPIQIRLEFRYSRNVSAGFGNQQKMPRTNPSTIDGLRENERLAADLLARGKTCREVARALGISERCLYNWRKRPAVQRAIYALQQELIDSSESQGLALMPEAIATLTAIMGDTNARASDRIAASRALLNGAAAYQERKLLERTIADLETQLYGVLNTRAIPEAPEDDVDPLMASADPEDE